MDMCTQFELIQFIVLRNFISSLIPIVIEKDNAVRFASQRRMTTNEKVLTLIRSMFEWISYVISNKSILYLNVSYCWFRQSLHYGCCNVSLQVKNTNVLTWLPWFYHMYSLKERHRTIVIHLHRSQENILTFAIFTFARLYYLLIWAQNSYITFSKCKRNIKNFLIDSLYKSYKRDN
jgi:hypothetical protein